MRKYTACYNIFTTGTKSAQACLITDEKKYDIDANDFKSSLLPWSEIKSQSVQLHWPRDRSPLLKNDDVQIIDSPGVDVDADFDEWIEEHCSDADLFVLVLNSGKIDLQFLPFTKNS